MYAMCLKLGKLPNPSVPFWHWLSSTVKGRKPPTSLKVQSTSFNIHHKPEKCSAPGALWSSNVVYIMSLYQTLSPEHKIESWCFIQACCSAEHRLINLCLSPTKEDLQPNPIPSGCTECSSTKMATAVSGGTTGATRGLLKGREWK